MRNSGEFSIEQYGQYVALIGDNENNNNNSALVNSLDVSKSINNSFI